MYICLFECQTLIHGLCSEHGVHGLCSEHGVHGLYSEHGIHGLCSEHGIHGLCSEHGIHGLCSEHGIINIILLYIITSCVCCLIVHENSLVRSMFIQVLFCHFLCPCISGLLLSVLFSSCFF